MRPRTFALVTAAIGVLFVCAAYVPDLGIGFVKDDAAWIATAREAIRHPASAFAVDSSGYFFRPLVTASFAADFSVYGTHALGYGATNLLLFALAVALIALLFRELGVASVGTAAALLAWALNPHGISMALLWISGRTSLLMTVCSVGSVLAFLRTRPAACAALLLAALFAKEDAVAIPVIAVACGYAAGRLTRRDTAIGLAWMAAAVAVYLGLRFRTSAMTPATAPWYYRLLTSPASIAVNAASYVDRAGTSAAVVTAVAALVYRRRARWEKLAPLLVAAGVWFAAGLAITVRIPVRSDLYAVFPSIGTALACAAIVNGLRQNVEESSLRARDRVFALVLMALLALVPVYRIRNARFAEPARVSALVQRQLASDAPLLPDRGTIVFEDTPSRFSTFADAFDGMSTAAVQLFTEKPLTGDIAMAPDVARRAGEVARYAMRDGKIARLR
jgi:hypothetical protein